MAYLNNSTRISSLLIGGVDYTNNFAVFTASDSSAFKAGLISTSGSLKLRSYGNSPPMEDYDRDNFKRGTEVIINVQPAGGGTPVRHPRGLLYVIGVGYNVEEDALDVEVGCRLALAALTENVSELLPYSPFHLDGDRITYQNISASLASAGKYLFQNNYGTLVSDYFFQDDETSSIAQGEWTSVFGVTTLGVQPLAGTAPIPDKIRLTYQVPADALSDDQSGKVQIDETTSYYFLSYPSIIYQRIPRDPIPQPPAPPAPEPTPPPRPSGCGNTPPPPPPPQQSPNPQQPGQGEKTSCSEDYETVQEQVYVSATRKEKRVSEYNGPSGQLSYVYSEAYAPAIEANSQYYADEYAYCRYSYASACMPNGNCPMGGLGNTKIGYAEQFNYYGPANELVKTVTDTYATELSAAQPTDWRSGVSKGQPQKVKTLNASSMYRASRQQVEYKYGKNQNIQTTTTWTSAASRGGGISHQDIDALSGIKTVEVRISTTISANPVSPDRANTVSTSTTEKERTILIGTHYLPSPGQAGPYEVQEQIPVPLLSEDPIYISNAVNRYSNYLVKFIKGDSYGLAITEVLRSDIISNWRPGKPFRYYDPRKGKVLAMRMDACSWGIGTDEAVVTTSGIWIGVSNGTVTIPKNLVGDSRPDMGGGTLPPVTPGPPPSVEGETSVDLGSFAWEVNIDIMTSVTKNFWGETGVFPILPSLENRTIQVKPVFTVWVRGFIATAGSLLSTEDDGSIPLSYNGSLLTVGATIVNADLFA